MKRIAIILILAFIVDSAMGALLLTHEHRSTRARIQTISKALQMYWDEYKQLPLTLRTDKVAADTIEILMGSDLWGQNKRRIAFLTVADFDHQSENVELRSNDGEMLDGWGNPLIIKLDHAIRRAEIRSPGSDGKFDPLIGDDEIEVLQFEQR